MQTIASPWDEYPETYRQREVESIQSAVTAGDCVSIIGLSGAGKSNLTGYLANRCTLELSIHLVDCNRLLHPTPQAFLQLVRRVLGVSDPTIDELAALEEALDQHLANGPLCLLFDRFDIFKPDELSSLASSLRALRDVHKYRLTYVTATRRPLDSLSELAELFYAHTLWLGPLSESDARWSIMRYSHRSGHTWDENTVRQILAFSRCYPSFVRAACEAAVDGCPVDTASLLTHPAVQRRLEEFWADQPTPEDLHQSGLDDHPLLLAFGRDSGDLTAKEALLLKYLKAHPKQVCEKDDLIRAVWPEIKVFEMGIQDDALSQLIRRLRRKIEADPANPKHILNVPGRGYRYID